MAVLGRRSRSSGSIAVEFALVVPIFLALVGGAFYFGLALYTRLVVTEAANTAVRNCVIRQVGNYSDASFATCATQEFATLTNNSGAYSILCGNGAPRASATTRPASYGKLSNAVSVLTLSVSCDVNLGSMMWMSGAGGGPTTKTLQIASAMPYSLSRPIN